MRADVVWAVRTVGADDADAGVDAVVRRVVAVDRSAAGRGDGAVPEICGAAAAGA